MTVKNDVYTHSEDLRLFLSAVVRHEKPCALIYREVSLLNDCMIHCMIHTEREMVREKVCTRGRGREGWINIALAGFSVFAKRWQSLLIRCHLKCHQVVY